MSDDHAYGETRGERRDRRLKAKRERMQQHGAGLRRTVTDSALRMAQRLVKRKRRR